MLYQLSYSRNAGIALSGEDECRAHLSIFPHYLQRHLMELRGVEPTANARYDYLQRHLMELRGVEPLTSAVRLQRSPS
jgi:hypothetical protein